MFSSLILTTGISALAPFNVLGKRLREQGSPVVFPDRQQNPDAADPDLPEEEVIKACLDWTAEIDPHTVDPTNISAELSLLNAIHEQRKELAPGAVVHLVHTASLGGRLAIQLQLRFLEQILGVQPHPEELSVSFDPGQPGGLALASGAVMDQISRLLSHYDPTTTVFSPIGGFKYMVAIGYAAASFRGYPSLYIHEDTQILQKIAPVPVAISSEVHSRIVSIARRLGNQAVEWTELSAEERDLITANPSFFVRVDDLVELSAIGQYLRLNEIPIRLSPDALAAYHKDPVQIRKQLLQIRDQAATDPNLKSINHSFVRNKGIAQPWRCAKMGSGIRHAWQITDAGLLIGRIWLRHADYDREAPHFVTTSIPSSANNWEPLPR